MRSQKARSCYHRGHGQKIAEYLPNYYGGAYKLETSENENQDMPGFIQEYTERIRTSNEEQGKMAFILDMAHARLQLSELFC